MPTQKITTMKKTLLSLSLILVIALVSCSDNSPEAPAKKWLNAYYTFQIDEAKKYSSEDTKGFMDMIQGMLAQSPIPDSIITIFKQTKIDIHSKDIKVTGDSATVPYTVTMPKMEGSPEIPPMDKTLKMVKKEGKWLAQYTMMDAMAENQEASGQIQEEQEGLENAQNSLEQADSMMQEKSAPVKMEESTEPAPEAAAE